MSSERAMSCDYVLQILTTCASILQYVHKCKHPKDELRNSQISLPCCERVFNGLPLHMQPSHAGQVNFT